jgi:DNA excision repair protein ERCC-4
LGIVVRVTILVDTEERHSPLPAHLLGLGFDLELVPLEVGDYVVGRWMVERKTVADLHRSVANGRIWGQIARLAREPGSRVLLVEGPDLDRGPLSRAGIRGALLQIVDNEINVLRSWDAAESALWLRLLARRRGGTPARGKRGRHQNVSSPVGVLAVVSGVTTRTAELLLARFGSVAGVAAATAEELQEVDGIGPHRSRALRRALGASPLNGVFPRHFSA